MKITCPMCGANGNLPDHEIPADGRFLTCPRCKHGFNVQQAKTTAGEYLVDSCPACAFSTFGEERFGTCPKCGVVIKTFVERQREEMAQAREHELLTRKFSRETAAPVPLPGTSPMPTSPATAPETNGNAIGQMIENLHPVNLVGWGCMAVATITCILGFLGLLDYYGEDIRARLSAERDEHVSALYVFLHFGMMPWIKVLFGGALLVISIYFLKCRAQALQALAWILWGVIAYVPVSMTIRFVLWCFEPIPHTWGGYSIEFINIIFMSALLGMPLYLLIKFLDSKSIRLVVKL